MIDDTGINFFSFLVFLGCGTSVDEARCLPLIEEDEEGSTREMSVEMEECLRLSGFESNVVEEVEVGLMA